MEQTSPASSCCPKCAGQRVEMLVTPPSYVYRCLMCGHAWGGPYLLLKPDRRRYSRY